MKNIFSDLAATLAVIFAAIGLVLFYMVLCVALPTIVIVLVLKLFGVV